MNSLVERVFRALTSWKRAAPVDEHEHIYTNEQHNHHYHHHHPLHNQSGASDSSNLSAAAAAAVSLANVGGIIWSTNHHHHNNYNQNSNSSHQNHQNRSQSDELIDLTQYPNNSSNQNQNSSSTTDSNQYYYTMSPNNSDQQQQTTMTTTTTTTTSGGSMNSEQNQTTQQQQTTVSTNNNNNSNQTQTTSTSAAANILRFSFINPSSTSTNERRSRHNHRHHRSSSQRNNNSNNQRQQTSNSSRGGGGGVGNEPASSASSSASSSMSDETSDLFSSSTTAANASLGVGKRRERNLLAACCSIFCIAVLCVSLVETRWFYLNGGGCNVNYIGVAHFFAPSPLDYQLEYSKVTKNEIVVYTFVLPNGLELKNCANREIMVIMRTVIAFVFLAIFSSSLALMLDTCGCMRPGMKLVRRHAIFHILTCIFCLAINGFCFWVSERMNEQQNETRSKRGKRVDVAFDVSYYLIVLASGLSILATAFTLIRRYPTDEDEQLERLLEEYTGFEEPLLHLERSLPAVSVNQPNQPQIHSCQVIRPHSTRRTHSQSSDQLHLSPPPGAPPPPPPPITPPPPLLNSSRVYQPVVMSTTTAATTSGTTSEPPPPYDPTPTFA